MKKGLAVLLTLFFILTLAPGCSPQAPQPMDNTRTSDKGPDKAEADQTRPDVLGKDKKVVMGFYVEGEGLIPSSKQSLSTNSALLDEVAFFWYTFDSNGNIRGMVKQDQSARTLAKNHNAKVYAIVNNLVPGGQGFNPDLAHQVVSNPKTRAKFVSNLVNLTTTKGWDGISIDIERTPPGDRNNFSAFIKELGAALKAKDKVLNVSVPAKFIDYPADLWAGAYDYAKIGQGADQIVLMTYDEHGLGTTAGPIASHDFVDKVISFAITKIPREKLVQGIPVYGYDWASNKPTVPAYLSYAQALKQAQLKGVTPIYDTETESVHYTYTQNGIRHVVYFENRRSIEAKLTYAKKYNIHGIAIWRMGMEDPSAWSAIKAVYGTNRGK
ncbi:MAG: glycosyl hydrolase family 18 protein [Peptococcaceae bacterium]|nr:glycosyl hydrolase family 18 protein [Peptococcaceae bacterium]